MVTVDEAIQLIQTGEVEKGLQILQQVAERATAEEKVDIAQIYVELGVQDAAQHILEEILAEQPYHEEASLLLADIYIDQNEDEKAISILDTFSEEDENYMQALVQLADLYQSQGLFEVAEEKLLKAKNLAPEEIIIDFGLAELLFSTGDYKKSIIYYEKVLQETEEFSDVNIHARLAEAYAINGEFERSLEAYQSFETDDSETLFRYGYLAYRAERYEIAIQVWEQLLENEIEYPTVYPYLSQAYEQEGMMEEAYQAAIDGVEMDPFNKEMWFIAGQIVHQYGDTNKAYEYMHESLKLDPEYKDPLLFLIEAYKREENYEQIIDLLTNQIDLDQMEGIFHWELAQALNEQEQFSDALIAYQTAYNTLEADVDFLKDYGYFLVEEGRIDEAIRIFESYIKLEPSDFDIQQYVDRLKSQSDDTLF
ncbi:hypothetical protein J416_04938 [Gracilibacillus halophilus YIM-C55.5]|uniref:Uncharacterized protein n=1 Tax=Gracilibacillus halophilus YIM-C55.5 TaxID=1308866 RepID=N4WMC3_9BACI|nr:tetratricopeptide repeat protein [Gracilibacillus halophilus]ENH97332.1 hypothetical protein J416_04938 [Gracilibacillus halophilus YIM-C55.5]